MTSKKTKTNQLRGKIELHLEVPEIVAGLEDQAKKDATTSGLLEIVNLDDPGDPEPHYHMNGTDFTVPKNSMAALEDRLNQILRAFGDARSDPVMLAIRTGERNTTDVPPTRYVSKQGSLECIQNYRIWIVKPTGEYHAPWMVCVPSPVEAEAYVWLHVRWQELESNEPSGAAHAATH